MTEHAPDPLALARRYERRAKAAHKEKDWPNVALWWGKATVAGSSVTAKGGALLATELKGRAEFILEHASRFVCNICGGTRFRDFKSRYLARCASCRSLERHRYMGLYLDRLGITENMKILHIAPDNGLWEKLHQVVGDNYFCADINSDRYVGRKNFTQIDLCEDLTPLDIGGYDIIIHSHTLEHLPCNYTCAMARLNALLKPTGRQLVVLPIFEGYYTEMIAPRGTEVDSFNRRYHHQVNHVRKFGKENLDVTFGMMFDFGPYRDYKMTDYVAEQDLGRANIPPLYWRGLNSCTIFDIPRSDFMRC